MKRREYLARIRDQVDQGYMDYQKKMKEYEKLRANRENGKYSYEYLTTTIIPKMNLLKREMDDIQYHVNVFVRSITEMRKESLKDFDRIRPEELTEDVKLLQGGLILEERDVQGIIDRNPGNRSMVQLALRYAEQHGMRIKADYASAQSMKQSYDAISGSVATVVKWYDSPKDYQRIYDAVMGDNSALAHFCDTDSEE